MGTATITSSRSETYKVSQLTSPLSLSQEHLNPTESDKRNKLVFQVSECNFLLVFCLIMMRITEMFPMMPPTMQRM